MFYFILCLWGFFLLHKKRHSRCDGQHSVHLCPRTSHFFPSALAALFATIKFSLIEEQEFPKVYWCEFHENNWLGQRRLLLMPVLRKRQRHESDKSTE